MPDPSQAETQFLAQLYDIIGKNMANEQFGVTELAEEMNMSRSNLLRKVKKSTDLPVNQLIREARLKRAMELLQSSALNVSEISHEVGFNSTSYFIKCFREYYGYPPGETGKRSAIEIAEAVKTTAVRRNRRKFFLAGAAVLGVLIIASLFFLLFKNQFSSTPSLERSIVVLPFKNESNDSSNVYLINGLMESTLNNLQKIEDLRVLSRTSSEKYRNTTKSIREMASELDANYFIEGSGQKIGDQILLNIQLIEGPTDKHLWAKQYRREAKDIFALQQEIAQNIADEIEVTISPEAKKSMEKIPTDDVVAYDYFLKGRDLFYKSGPNDLVASIPWFQKAIERDPEFSLAYATAAMVYYYLDIFNLEKKHAADVENYAEKAILYDEQSSESMVAKGLSFVIKGQYELSIPYFEKALQYEPRSGLVLHFLTEFYNLYLPNPPKYLEYALKKAEIDQHNDSSTASFSYFHLSNALLQNGFFDESLKFNTKSLELNPKNFFAGFVREFILYAKDHDCRKAKERLTARWEKDTTRFDMLKEIGMMNCMMGDFAAADSCYDRAMATMKMFGLDVFKHEYLRMGWVAEKVGKKEKAEDYIKKFKEFADHDLTMYKGIYLATYHFTKNENEKGFALLEDFAKTQDNFLYWVLLMPEDPMFETLKNDPRFKSSVKEIERKYWKKHDEMDKKWGDEFRALLAE